MRPSGLAPRLLALITGFALSLPTPAYAFRVSQPEDESQQASMEQALKSPTSLSGSPIRANVFSAGLEETIWPDTTPLSFQEIEPILILQAEGGFGDIAYLMRLVESFNARRVTPVVAVVGPQEKRAAALSKFDQMREEISLNYFLWVEDGGQLKANDRPVDGDRPLRPVLIQHFSQVNPDWARDTANRLVPDLFQPLYRQRGSFLLVGYNAPGNAFGGYLKPEHGEFLNLYQTLPAEPGPHQPNPIYTGNPFDRGLKDLIERQLRLLSRKARRAAAIEALKLPEELAEAAKSKGGWASLYTSQGGSPTQLKALAQAFSDSYGTAAFFTFFGKNPRLWYYPDDYWKPHEEIVDSLKENSKVSFVDVSGIFGSRERLDAPILVVNLGRVTREDVRLLAGASDLMLAPGHNTFVNAMGMAARQVGPKVVLSMPVFRAEREELQRVLRSIGARRTLEEIAAFDRLREPGLAPEVVFEVAVKRLTQLLKNRKRQQRFQRDIARLATLAMERSGDPADGNLGNRLLDLLARVDRGAALSELISTPRQTPEAIEEVRDYQRQAAETFRRTGQEPHLSASSGLDEAEGPVELGVQNGLVIQSIVALTPEVRQAINRLEQNMPEEARMPVDLLNRHLRHPERILLIAQSESRQVLGYIFGVPQRAVGETVPRDAQGRPLYEPVDQTFYEMSWQVLPEYQAQRIGTTLRRLFRDEVRKTRYLYLAFHQKDRYAEAQLDQELSARFLQGDELFYFQGSLPPLPGTSSLQQFVAIRLNKSAAQGRFSGLEEVKVEEPISWEGYDGSLGKVRPLTLGGQGVGRAIFLDEQRIRLVSFWNPEISSPSYPRWQHPPIQDREELKRLHQTGLTLEEWKQKAQEPSPGLEGTRLALLSNSIQTNLHQPWGFLIVEGKTIRPAYAHEEYPLQAHGLSEKGYDDALWTFVLEPGPPRVTAIRFDSENQPIEELQDIRIERGRPLAPRSSPAQVEHAIFGLPLILHREDVSSQIQTHAPPPIRELRPNEVVWPPSTTEAAFSALGVTADGQLVLVALTAERTVGQVAQLLLKLGMIHAVLLEGSAGVQQWMHGGDPPLLQAEAWKGSTRPGKGRLLNAVLVFYELPKAGLEEVAGAMERWFGPRSARAGEKRLAEFLAERGEGAIREFVRRIEEDRGLPAGSLGPYEIPPFDSSQIPPAGLTSAGLAIPSTVEAYEKERLRLMAEVAVQRALGRQIVVNIGIGFVGATVMIANAQARTTLSGPSFAKPLQYRAPLSGKGQAPYFALGYNRPSTDSYYKIEYVNQGRAPIRTVDRSIERKIKEAHRRGNIRATFLKEAIAVADFAMVDTELHVRKLVPRHLELSRTDPGPTLRLLEEVGRLVPKDVTVLIESTVYPGFTLYDALPVINEQLRKRGLLAEGEDAPLAYSFQRVEPGPRLFKSLMELQRVGAGVTPKAREGLRRYYETVGFNYRIWDETTTPEFIKDVENAYRFGLIELMGAFLRGAELAGVNAFEVIEAIASARPETHGTIRFAPALQVGGYCIPKELVMVILGLKSHFGLSDLQIRRIFHTRLAAAVASDFRAESAVVRLLGSLADVGLSLDESTIHWMGVAYNPGVGDTRYSGTERGLRLAAHYGARHEATDPYVHHWPELQQQRLGDPESWGFGLLNQEGLRELEVQATEDPYETIHPRQDALVLATRHPPYVGQGQPEEMRTFVIEGKPNVYPGLDPTKVTARMMGREGKVILDSFNFLSDQDIKKFLALGWKVVGFGKGHINHLAEQVTVQERRETAEQLLGELIHLRGEKGADGEELEEAIRTLREKVQYLQVLDPRPPQDAEVARLSEARYQLAKARQERRYAKPGQAPLVEARVRLAEARLRPSIPEVEAASQEVEELTRQRNEVVLKNAQKVLIQPAQGKVQELFRDAAALMEAFRFAAEGRSLVVPQSVQQAVQIAESLLYLKDRTEDLALDVDRAFEELVTPEGKVAAAVAMRKTQVRPELAFPEKQVAVVYTQDEDGKLRRKVDPEGYPNRLSVKTIKDMAQGKRNIPQGRPGDKGDWTKYTKVLPLNLVPAEEIELEAYPDFQELPWEFRHWLLTEVIGKGYVLSAMEGMPQDKFGYAMDVNLDPKTWARGRGGILFFADTRQPLAITTEQGRELIVDIKAVGPYGGGDPKALGLSFDRVTATGMVSGGTVGRMQVGQVAGHMSSAEEIPRLHRLMRTEEAHQGQAPRPLFRVRWKYRGGPDTQFQMVARASPTNQRIGQIFIGGEEDFNPAQVARIMGENAARVLTQPIAGVHEGLNGDNILATGHYTDLAGQIDLFNERDPFGAFYKYFGFYLMLVLYSFDEISKNDTSQADVRFIQDWLNGFLDKFFSSEQGIRVRNRRRFERFYRMGDRLDQPNVFIEDLIQTMWEQYLPYRLLKNRLEYGYDPTEESTYSAGSLETIYHPETENAARKFIEDQRKLLQIAERMMTPPEKGGEGYVPLKFDFQAAYQELEAKIRRIGETAASNPSADPPAYAEIYRLSFYPPRAPEVYPILADIEAMTRGEEAVRLVMKVAEPTVFFDKADVGAQAHLAARKAREVPAAGLEEDWATTGLRSSVSTSGAVAAQGTRMGTPPANLPETRVAVISAEAAGRYSELAEWTGSVRSIGDVRLIVLSEDSVQWSSPLASILDDAAGRPIAVQEFGGENDPTLARFEQVIAPLRFRMIGRQPLTGRNFLEALRQIVANLAGWEEDAISPEQMDEVQRALGLGAHV